MLTRLFMPAHQRFFPILFLIAIFLLQACDDPPRTPSPPLPAEEEEKTELHLEPADFSQLTGWEQDDFMNFIPALSRSCKVFMARNGDEVSGRGKLKIPVRTWQEICAKLPETRATTQEIKQFLETRFTPFLATNNKTGRAEGLFTGYFEPEFHGSRVPSDHFKVPLYKTPDDLITLNLGQFDAELKGKQIVGRIKEKAFLPYYKRAELEQGVLAGRGLELIWLHDPVDVFLLQVQGSGKIFLKEDHAVRVGFAAHNGHRYRSIGRQLIKMGALKPHEASWERIRRWVEKNTTQAATLFAHNPRFIFFREIQGDGPVGAQGVALTPQRSLAVDLRYIPLGLPLWLETTFPGKSTEKLHRLMVTQDTGNAIRGPVRGDFFWGSGDEALAQAGRMKSRGQYYLLLPNQVARDYAENFVKPVEPPKQ